MTQVPTPIRKAVIVHHLAHIMAAAEAAASLGVPVTVRSVPGAARVLGPGVFKAMVEAARTSVPAADMVAVLDCEAEPGDALSALRHGIDRVRLDPAVAAYPRVAAIAESQGRSMDEDPSPALDLAAVPKGTDPSELAVACRNWLADGVKSCVEAAHPSCQRGVPRVSESHGTVFHGFSTTGEIRL